MERMSEEGMTMFMYCLTGFIIFIFVVIALVMPRDGLDNR